jgi:hypothetical protein
MKNLEERIISAFCKRITELRDIKEEIKNKELTIEDAEYEIETFLPKIKSELKMLNEMFITNFIIETNEIENFEIPLWYQSYSILQNLLIEVEVKLELELERLNKLTYTNEAMLEMRFK